MLLKLKELCFKTNILKYMLDILKHLLYIITIKNRTTESEEINMEKQYMIERIIENLNKLNLHFLKCVLVFTDGLAN